MEGLEAGDRELFKCFGGVSINAQMHATLGLIIFAIRTRSCFRTNDDVLIAAPSLM